eukprot:s2024_g9.t1
MPASVTSGCLWRPCCYRPESKMHPKGSLAMHSVTSEDFINCHSDIRKRAFASERHMAPPDSAGGNVTVQRIDPKVLAGMVNRFVTETGSFLEAFATKAEAKLMKLDQRVERLERPPSLGPDLPNVLQRGPGLLRCRRQKYPEAIRRY